MRSVKVRQAASHPALRQCAFMGVSVLAAWLLRDHIAAIDVAAVLDLFAQFPLHIWASAAAFTTISLIAVGGYDVVIARHLGLPILAKQAFSAGWRATAIAQTLGFGVFTGALVRWRILGRHDGLTLWTATQMTAAVTACFFGGWAVIASTTALVTPGLPDRIWWLGLLGFWLAACATAYVLRHGAQVPRSLPSLRMAGHITWLTAIDTLAASAVIYCFLPDSFTPFLMLYAAFMTSIAVGMISTVPGGVGPFELCLVSLLAPADPTPLLAACLGYRAAYYLAPALLAGVSVLLSKTRPQDLKARIAPTSTPIPAPLAPAHRAALTAQTHVQHLRGADGAGLGRETPNCDVLLYDPSPGSERAFLTARIAHARRHFRDVFLYKCGSQTAQIAKRLGLRVHHIASEAVLDPQDFNLTAPSRATLRRKLRKAGKARVVASKHAPGWPVLQRIDAAWQRRNGRALGFSMGICDRALLARQAVFTASINGDAVAFISFHADPDRWTLDLMRSVGDVPDGTMHALITAALEDAKNQGVAELSLCSVPLHLTHPPKTWVEHVATALFDHTATGAGLLRFKSTFAPDWRPQFIASTSRFGLFIGAYATYRLIHTPDPPRQKMHRNHNDYDLYEFASHEAPCEIRL